MKTLKWSKIRRSKVRRSRRQGATKVESVFEEILAPSQKWTPDGGRNSRDDRQRRRSPRRQRRRSPRRPWPCRPRATAPTASASMVRPGGSAAGDETTTMMWRRRCDDDDVTKDGREEDTRSIHAKSFDVWDSQWYMSEPAFRLRTSSTYHHA